MKKNNECPVCGSGMEVLIDLPRLPMTEQYEKWSAAEFSDRGYVDQKFLYCEPCSHGKLETIVPPEVLYGKTYRTVSSKSVGSFGAISHFAQFVKEMVPEYQYQCVVDIGGNDGTLLSLFPGKRLVAVDPNASGDGVELIKEFIETADLSHLNTLDKLILCSHTLEHIEKPESIFRKLRDTVSMNDYCAFQFPCLDLMVRDSRIDQIHHQHIHYYSRRSISLLLKQYGFEVSAERFDSSHYGTLMLIFRRGIEDVGGSTIASSEIEEANHLFCDEMASLDNKLAMELGVVGYGASLMLPLLKYYLPALNGLACVVDEDESKHGQRYTNFNVEIRPTQDLSGLSVMVTAFNTKMAVRKIVEKLFAKQVKNIIVPFHYL